MIHINNLSKRFGLKNVLKDVNYRFPDSGIIALVGVNGAGKTTLLNILCNLDHPDAGSLNMSKQKILAYLPQEPNQNPKNSILEECMSANERLYELRDRLAFLTKEIEDAYTDEKYYEFEEVEREYREKSGYSFENDTIKILNGLGFLEENVSNDPKSLSGGWKMRLEFAKLLVKDPDFLILDEPTNHLDLPSIIWLENYLKKLDSVILFVSHDITLLNNLPNIMLHLKDGKLTEYRGNYDDFLEQYELRQMGKVAELKNIQNKIKKAADFVERFGAKASKAAQARSRMKMISKLQNESSSVEIQDNDKEISFKIPITQKSGKDVLHLDKCSIGYTEKTLIKNMSLFVRRGQRIGVVGANGMGKSTLIKTIAGEIPLISGEIKMGYNVVIAHYNQDQFESLDMKSNVFENLRKSSETISDFEARSLLGSFLFKGDDVYKTVGILSGGEKSRLSLACMLAKNANLLLLDEPTNHLDILSTEILINALVEYEGTVIFVSHNRTFIDSVATDIFDISEEIKYGHSKK